MALALTSEALPEVRSNDSKAWLGALSWKSKPCWGWSGGIWRRTINGVGPPWDGAGDRAKGTPEKTRLSDLSPVR